MRFLFSNIVGAIIRVVVIAVIGAFLAAYQLSPQGLAEALFKSPPQWMTNPLVRLASFLVGGAIVMLLLIWERIFAAPLDRNRRALVERAFKNLPADAIEWLNQHHAGGRPSGSFAEILHEQNLVDRDFVGYTGVRPELQSFVAARLHADQSIFSRLFRTIANMTPQAIVVACLSVSLVLILVALVVLVRENRSAKPAIASVEKTVSSSDVNLTQVQSAPPSAIQAPTATVPASQLQPQKREYSDRAAGELLTFYEGRTPFQAEALMEPYKGKWIIAEGKVVNLLADGIVGHSIAILQSGRFIVECRLDSRWAAVVAKLNKGDPMKVEGKINPFQNGSQLYLSNCEIVQK